MKCSYFVWHDQKRYTGILEYSLPRFKSLSFRSWSQKIKIIFAIHSVVFWRLTRTIICLLTKTYVTFSHQDIHVLSFVGIWIFKRCLMSDLYPSLLWKTRAIRCLMYLYAIYMEVNIVKCFSLDCTPTALSIILLDCEQEYMYLEWLVKLRAKRKLFSYNYLRAESLLFFKTSVTKARFKWIYLHCALQLWTRQKCFV